MGEKTIREITVQFVGDTCLARLRAFLQMKYTLDEHSCGNQFLLDLVLAIDRGDTHFRVEENPCVEEEKCSE